MEKSMIIVKVCNISVDESPKYKYTRHFLFNLNPSFIHTFHPLLTSFSLLHRTGSPRLPLRSFTGSSASRGGSARRSAQAPEAESRLFEHVDNRITSPLPPAFHRDPQTPRNRVRQRRNRAGAEAEPNPNQSRSPSRRWWPSSESEWRTRSTARTSRSGETSPSPRGRWRKRASAPGCSHSSSSSSVDQPFSRSFRASGWACNHGNALGVELSL